MTREQARVLLRDIAGRVQALAKEARAEARERQRLADLLDHAMDQADFAALTELGVLTPDEERQAREARTRLRSA